MRYGGISWDFKAKSGGTQHTHTHEDLAGIFGDYYLRNPKVWTSEFSFLTFPHIKWSALRYFKIIRFSDIFRPSKLIQNDTKTDVVSSQTCLTSFGNHCRTRERNPRIPPGSHHISLISSCHTHAIPSGVINRGLLGNPLGMVGFNKKLTYEWCIFQQTGWSWWQSTFGTTTSTAFKFFYHINMWTIMSTHDMNNKI